MIRPHDYIDGAMADQIAGEVASDAHWSLRMTEKAIDIEGEIAAHILLDTNGRGFWPKLAADYRDAASWWWDAALMGDFERGAMP